MPHAALSREQVTEWGRIALISVCVGMSLGLLLTVTWLGIVWLNGIYPPPLAAWDQTAIVAEHRPAVDINGHDTELTYVLINKTNEDYRIEYDAQLPVLLRDTQGKLWWLEKEDRVF